MAHVLAALCAIVEDPINVGRVLTVAGVRWWKTQCWSCTDCHMFAIVEDPMLAMYWLSYGCDSGRTSVVQVLTALCAIVEDLILGMHWLSYVCDSGRSNVGRVLAVVCLRQWEIQSWSCTGCVCVQQWKN